MNGPWPRLSEIDGPRDLRVCQRCTRDTETVEVTRWQEHDSLDKPEPRVVCLCDDCSGLIVEPHPRLYRKMDDWEPMPGAMELCCDCRHQESLSCRHPDLKSNGGKGLRLTLPQPTRMFACSRRSEGGSGCRVITQYHGPVSECAGKETRGNVG